MSEYALRKSDRTEIYLGCCEDIRNLRYTDRNKVEKVRGSLDPSDVINCFWRIPVPEENDVLPGGYEGKATYRLHKASELPGYGEDYKPGFEIEPGSFQMKHESGLLLNVKCYHGLKLQEKTDDYYSHWNGKSYAFELVRIKNTKEGLFPIVGCRFCGNWWRESWENIMPYVSDLGMKCNLLDLQKETL